MIVSYLEWLGKWAAKLEMKQICWIRNKSILAENSGVLRKRFREHSLENLLERFLFLTG